MIGPQLLARLVDKIGKLRRTKFISVVINHRWIKDFPFNELVVKPLQTARTKTRQCPQDPFKVVTAR